MTTSPTSNGGPAFPHHIEHPNGHSPGVTHAGISVRDYFAAKAMQGMLANPELKDSIFQGAEHGVLEKSAWAIADAMIKERNT